MRLIDASFVAALTWSGDSNGVEGSRSRACTPGVALICSFSRPSICTLLRAVLVVLPEGTSSFVRNCLETLLSASHSQASIMPSVQSSLLLLSGIDFALSAAVNRRGVTPALPVDAGVTSQCTWWHDQHEEVDCDSILDENNIDLATFRRWNPAIGANCAGLSVGKSYCVEAAFEVLTTSSTTASVTHSAGTTTPTSTAPPNGIETPSPNQSGMVGNCDAFHFVEPDQDCAAIAALNGITQSQFHSWNPAAGANCAGLWANTYVCVSVIGHTPVTSVTPSPTATSNGIETPLPTQPSMVNNCAAFYLVKAGDSCSVIASNHGITMAQFTQWNPRVGSDCAGMWADAYACVSTIGHTPVTSSTASPSPTRPANGIETPSPAQPGMVTNCDAFYKVKIGDECSTIASTHGITLSQFTTWNPRAGSDCSGLWADAYACVSIIGHTPTPTPTRTSSTTASPSPTRPANGIETPQPAQPGMVSNCDKFYKVKTGDGCSGIAASNGITLAQFTTWNPRAGDDCKGLWADAWACVSIVGHTPTTTTTKATTTTTNPTPTPIQSGMVKNCNKFHKVGTSQGCPAIQSLYKVSLAQLYKWNPAIKSDCSGMWANTYLCVGVSS
ncbi:carbohydrate-binding module family 50 protein [Sporormia fimetaria CBS 119925]|uniref:Carbohydrate-binding module family 50 protein n=1 Tax=Sporormia fimetaria CBS 119925 TaxID=1340428 RepID=A0A6A6VLE5_9PLEO|nr:carbohydrate-binding module family 50 protein [Sporormia fimetaria CBS 119925]